MRRWLLILMVMLLPLRGGLGVAMAADMMQQHLAPPVGLVAVQAAAAHDCDGHHGASAVEAEPAEAAGDPEPGDCPTCASCQVCSSVVLLPPAFPDTLQPLPNPVPLLSVAGYTSPAPLLALKPPQA